MVGWIILGVIVLLIVAIMLITVGADVNYEDGQLRVSAKFCGILLQLYPKEGEQKPEEPKPPKEKKPPKPKPEKPKKKKKPTTLSFTKEELVSLVKSVLRGIGKFGKLRVDRFMLHFTAGGKDPFETAKLNNTVNFVLSTLAPICREKFIVKDTDVWTDIDFVADSMKIDAGLCIVIRIGQIFRMIFGILFGVLGVLIKNKLRHIRNRKHPEREADDIKLTLGGDKSEENEEAPADAAKEPPKEEEPFVMCNKDQNKQQEESKQQEENKHQEERIDSHGK